MAENTKAQFSIGFDDEGGNVPGVTQLLNPKFMAEQASRKAASKPPPIMKKAAPAQAASVIQGPVTHPISEGIEIGLSFSSDTASHHPPETVLPKRSESAVPKLSELGVQFELLFEKKQNFFRYSKIKAHSSLEWQTWQENFFQLMKIDLRALGIQVSFQEFSHKQHPFPADAFGLEESGFVQVVQLEEEPEKMYILLSTQSLLLQQDEVRTALIGKSTTNDVSDEDDFKIELAS